MENGSPSYSQMFGARRLSSLSSSSSVDLEHEHNELDTALRRAQMAEARGRALEQKLQSIDFAMRAVEQALAESQQSGADLMRETSSAITRAVAETEERSAPNILQPRPPPPATSSHHHSRYRQLA
jgi:hypothetical protein